MSGTIECPKGHASTEADYCSECGAKMQGAGMQGAGMQGAGMQGSRMQADRMQGAGAVNGGGSRQEGSAAGEICPDCGTVRDNRDTVFCEVCGFNFATGAHGEVAVATASDSEQAEPAPVVPSEPSGLSEPVVDAAPPAPRWSVVASVDASLRGPESPEPPPDVASFAVLLHQPTNLIGRKNEARGIFPEIALPYDEAVSRRHALLQLDAEGGLLLRDIGAANGTRLNGKDLEPMVDTPVSDGDEITLGHWSRLRIQRS